MHCTRANWQSIERASARASAVLPTPGVVLDQHVPLGEQRDDHVLERLPAHLHRARDVVREPPRERGECLRLLRRYPRLFG